MHWISLEGTLSRSILRRTQAQIMKPRTNIGDCHSMSCGSSGGRLCLSISTLVMITDLVMTQVSDDSWYNMFILLMSCSATVDVTA